MRQFLFILLVILPSLAQSQSSRKKNFYNYPFEILNYGKSETECLPLKEAITLEPLKLNSPELAEYYFSGNYNDYRNTVIATKEFEDRHKNYCRSKLIKLYINNLEKNLWEIDELAVSMLKEQLEKDLKYFSKSKTSIDPDYIKEYTQHFKELITLFEGYVAQKLEKPVIIDYSSFNWRESKELSTGLRNQKVFSNDISEIVLFIDSRKKAKPAK